MVLGSSRASSAALLRRRPRLIAATVSLVLAFGTLTGCTVTAGSAVLVDGNTFSESAVQQDTASFIAENPATTAVNDAQTAIVNRAQITYLVRHALFAKAIAAQGIVITDQELNEATAQLKAQSQGASLASSLKLPTSDESGVIRDLVAVDALVKALPSAGVSVSNVSVTTEGVPAATRDEAVSLRSKYLADPGVMDAAVTAAGTDGVPKNVYSLVQQPLPGAAGLYQPSSGSVVIVPNAPGYLVLRTTGRTVGTASLTPAAFTSASQSGLATVFDLGALLVAKYQDGAGISVNPRYGVWDPASVQVVPGNDGL